MNLKLIKGIFIGLLAPISAFVVYVAFFTQESDPLIMYHYIISIGKLPHVISLSLLINLLIFYMKIKTNRDEHARGILFSTILYGILIVVLKFL
tara:strand:- start:174 stop:455 length:282 start_codon:yes stop_codon:yes gene_type:complete